MSRSTTGNGDVTVLPPAGSSRLPSLRMTSPTSGPRWGPASAAGGVDWPSSPPSAYIAQTGPWGYKMAESRATAGGDPRLHDTGARDTYGGFLVHFYTSA